jgi:predicted ATPase
MIHRIKIENFKSLRSVDLKLGRLNVFIGTNASGKSNLYDALRVLKLIAGGFSIKELFEGIPYPVAGETSPGVRGGLANAVYLGPGDVKPASSMEISLELDLDAGIARAHYRIGFNSRGEVTTEKLARDGKEVFLFDGYKPYFRYPDGSVQDSSLGSAGGSRLVEGFLSGLAGAYKEFVQNWREAMQGMQFLELEPEVLRRYGSAEETSAMGEHGENFASLVRYICSDPKRKASYLNWLQELRPHEVDDVVTLAGAKGEPLFALREKERKFTADVLSDGTLRFAALTAAFFRPAMPAVLAIEEIENGIHASRLRLLMELVRTQAPIAQTQVLATTHSPLLSDWLNPEEYETTFLCKRDESTGESRILPLRSVPHFNQVVGRQPISELIAEGWMEAVA